MLPEKFFIIALFPILLIYILNLYSNELFKIYQHFTQNISLSNHPHIGLNISQIIEKDGYPVEIHKITTEDGYILTYLRVPFGRNSKNKNIKRPPILIHHGFGCTASDFFVLGPEKSLAYKLAEEGGYDVWLANNRGNLYSKDHIGLDINSKEFWNFSFDEIGRYDIPAAINYILKQTNEQKLFYIGHSMGTTILYLAMSEFPELNDKIRLMVSMAPSVYFTKELPVFINIAKKYSNFFNNFYELFGSYEIVPRFILHLFPLIGRTFCAENNPQIFRRFCTHILNTFCVNTDDERIDNSILPFIFQFFPSGAGMKVYHHLAQVVFSNEFKQFNYGSEAQNAKIYGQPKPPFYKLSNVKAPIVIYNGEAEVFFSPQNDTGRLVSELPNVVGNFIIERADFSHLDFLWASDAHIILYDKIINFLKDY